MVGIAVQEHHVHRQLCEGPDEVGEQRGVGQVEGEVGIAVAGVDLQGEALVSGERSCGPEPMAEEDGILDAGRTTLRQPPGRRVHDFPGRGGRGVEAEPTPVGDHGLQPYGFRRRDLQGTGEGGGVGGGVDALACHRLGDGLQPHHLMSRRGRQRPHGRGAQDVGGGRVAGLHQQGLQSGRPQEPPLDLLCAQLRPPGQVLVGRRQRLQLQHRGAPPPDGQPHRGIEVARPLRRGVEPLVDEPFERPTVEVVGHHPVAVMIDQGELAARHDVPSSVRGLRPGAAATLRPRPGA